MPGKKKLINLRKTNRFRFVRQPESMRPAPGGIKWSSCNSTMNPQSKGGGGGSPVFQTAYGVTYLGWRFQQAGAQLLAQGFASSVFRQSLNLPAFLIGAGLNAYGATLTAKFTRPCSEQDENRSQF